MQGISKSGSVATGGPMAPPTMERRQQAATDRPWNRPGKAPPTMLMRPTGGMMDDQVEFQDSGFWTPQVLNAVQDVIEEEALFYKPPHKSDKWDYIEMDGVRWLIRYHGASRVQRFHPEHRSCPEEITDLEFMRVTLAWKGQEWNRRVVIDSDWRRSELTGPAAWVGFSLFLIRSGPRSM